MKSEMCAGKISVIIPVYRVEKTLLRRAINSVRNQSYPNWEAIVVDDGNGVETRMLCDEFAQSDDRIFVLHQTNGGASAARNAGLRTATGEYLMFLDADDEFLVNAFEILVHEMNRHQVACIAFGWYIVGNWGIKTIAVTEQYQTVSAQDACCQIVSNNEKLGGGYPWTKIWRMVALQDSKGKLPLFDTALLAYEDKLWTVEALKRIHSVGVLPQQLYRYYENENSQTHHAAYRSRNAVNSIVAYRKIVDDLQNNSEAHRAAIAFGNSLAAQELFAAARYYPQDEEAYHRIQAVCAENSSWIGLKNMPYLKQKMQWLILHAAPKCPRWLTALFVFLHKMAALIKSKDEKS